MKQLTGYEEKKVYKIMQMLFLALGILLFLVVENYIVVRLFKNGEVAVQDFAVACEQTDEGKYYVSTQEGFANVYNGTGRNIEDLVVTVRYVNSLGKTATSYELEVGDFEPYMLDGKFNAYQLFFRIEPKSDVLSDTPILWLEFDVESYDVATGLFDYLMIGAFVIACVSIFMFWRSRVLYKSVSGETATSVAVIGEDVCETEDIPEAQEE